jgi:cytochrome c-type biogenesis protein CcmF
MDQVIFSSPFLGIGVTLGNLAIWLGLTSAITCTVLYWIAMVRTMRLHPEGSPVNWPAAVEAEGSAKAGGKKGRHSREDELSAADRKTERIQLWARRFFYITCGCFVVGALCLWALIFGQQYNLHYVWKNSNRDLHPGFRFASFWSDQDGTFFLWGLYNLVLGSVFLRRNRADERWVMPFFCLINVSLFTLLCFMNPFWLHSAADVRKELQSLDLPADALSFLPQNTWQHIVYYLGFGTYPILRDGRGLNEQLQNFWMVIHPPTLFVGYSSMIIPGCFALAALARRDYDSWVNRAAPWLMFSWSVLALGIFLGAYWAYETLGWGGYWSWDPVENSSVIPWLVGTALLHGLLAQRNRGNFKQANLFLGLLAGNAVLLGSFLVRSGALDGISVHSFASPQKSVFITLLGIMVIWFVLSIGLWVWRFKDIQSEIAYEHVWERHFGFFLGLIVLSASAIVVIFGVTLPIWKPWLYALFQPGVQVKKESIEYTFYNKALLPVAFVMVLLMGITPLMPWRRVREENRPMKPFNMAALGLAAVITLFFLFAAAHAWQGGFKTQNDPAYIAFGLILALTVLTNVTVAARAARGGFLNVGPWIAHLGFITMLAGIVITSRFNTVHEARKIEPNEGVTVLNRQFIYRRQRPASGPADRERLVIDMKFADGRVVTLEPKLFKSKISGDPMAWPVIYSEWFGPAMGDIYVSPSGVDNTGIIELKDVRKGDPEPSGVQIQHRRTDPTDLVALSLVGLDTSEMQKALQAHSQTGFTVYADVLLNINGVERRVRPALQLLTEGGSARTKPVPLRIEGLQQKTGYTLQFRDTNLKPGELTATFELVPDQPVQQAYFQVLHVPGIQVLWFGCYIMIAGSFMCFARRVRFARRPVPVRSPQAARVRRPEGAPRAEPAGAE